MKVFLRRVGKLFGPGFVTGASDNDPTAVATYSQTGALFGLSQLWTAAFTLPFMIAIQEMCGRIGIVTGMGLAGVIKRHYSRVILYGAVGLLLLANTFNIGADLGAMAASLQLLVPLPYFWLLLCIAIGPMVLEIVVPYPTYARFLKYISLVLLAYLLTALVVVSDWGAVAREVVTPHVVWSGPFVLNLAAILGTTISPYLFFWQSDQEVEEELVKGKISAVGRGKPGVRAGDLRILRYTTAFGMLFSQLVTVFIIITAASTLGAAGITTVSNAAQAAEALKPLAGNVAYLLFTLGIVGTGLLAVPVLAGSGAYAVSEMFGWHASLGRTFRQAPEFYSVIIISTLVGMLISLAPFNPIRMLYYSSVVNGLVAPVLMFLILLIGNNRKIMGARSNSVISNLFGFTITIVMGGIAILLIWQYFNA